MKTEIANFVQTMCSMDSGARDIIYEAVKEYHKKRNDLDIAIEALSEYMENSIFTPRTERKYCIKQD